MNLLHSKAKLATSRGIRETIYLTLMIYFLRKNVSGADYAD